MITQMTEDKTTIGAEAAVLGSMILDREAVDIVRDILRTDDFVLAEHRIVCDAIFALSEEGDGQIDIVRLRDWLAARDWLDAVGGVDYLIKLAEAVPTSANAEFYARTVKEHSARRQIAGIAQGILMRCIRPEGADAEQIRADAIEDLAEVIDIAEKGAVALSDALAAIDPTDDTLFVPSGFRAIDGVIGGLGRGHFVIIAGRPGMGKSALMAEIALRLAENRKKILFFSLEMTPADIALRMVCSRAGLDLQRAIRGGLIEEERLLFDEAKNYLQALPITFDSRSLTPARLRSAVLAAKRRGACDAVFVDYLGLMRPDENARSKYEATTEISNSLKRLALDTDIPVIAGCQLNRQNEYRDKKRPTLADLRDSGSIEQDADVVMLLHRPHYYEHTAEPELCECIVAKNRRGQTRTVNLGFTEIYTRFYDYDN